MPSTSITDIHKFNTPRIVGGQTTTPRTYKASKSSKYVNLSKQALKIGHQRVNIDVDLSQNKIDGFTELTILPTSSSLKTVRLDCREMKIKNIYINNTRCTNYIYQDNLYINDEKLFDEFIEKQVVNVLDLYSTDITIHQHHLIRQKLNNIFGELNQDPRDPPIEIHNGNTEELLIVLPDNLKLELADVSSLQTPGSQIASLTPLHLKNKNTMSDVYTPFNLKIEYETINPKNGVNFVTNRKYDKRTWHAYTVNSEYNISTSSWVPCIDDIWERSTWTIEVNVPRTIRDIGAPRIIGEDANGTNKPIKSKKATQIHDSGENEEIINIEDNKHNIANNETDEDDEDDDYDDEFSENFDIVVCSGDFNNVKETPHPIDLSKKLVSWSIFNSVCAHHVGWALGCFRSILLSNQSQDLEEETLKDPVAFDNLDKDNAIPVTIYVLPDQLELAKNTCVFVTRALEFFSNEFGSFPFSSYAIAFVSYSTSDSNNFAGLSIANEKLLYPCNLIEPMFTTTEILLESIAGQWAGINITPQTFNDMWCTIGIAKFMSLQFIRILMGANEYRFRIKMKMNEIVEEDIGKKPLAQHFFRFPISDLDLDFIRLKAPLVLFILDKRMTKTDKSFGLSRVLPKIFLQAMSGDLQNSALSTQHFQYVCEKVNRNKLETFFKQWVFGAGVPIFNISQKFNKKRLLIEMSIRQVQQQETKKVRPQIKSFIDDAISQIDDEPSYQVQPVFSGPMTIRVHEADGTPYEHIVDLKEGNAKLDIQYNSRLKRLKKNKEDLNESTSFSKLGDVLESENDAEEWGFSEWVRDEEDILNTDAFEWIRVDADFEWIAKINLNQPDYMYGSQLQYDRDVEAQYDAVQYFGDREKPNIIYCTVLTRTLMDTRYYYGIRTAAADALAEFSKPENNFIGVGYLMKVFKKLFCFPGSLIPLSNDFNDFGNFFLQKDFPRILSKIRDEDGEVIPTVKTLLLNLVKFNDNTNNSFQDCFYLAEVLDALTDSTISSTFSVSSQEALILSDSLRSIGSENQEFLNNVIVEISRLQKLDEWVPSYQNVIAMACLKQKIKLATHGLLKLTFEELLYFTLERYPFEIRIAAFQGLFLMGGLKNASILRYFLKTCLLDSSVSYFRVRLIQVFVNSICIAAIEGTPSTLDDPEFKTLEKLADNSSIATTQTNMVIIEDESNNEINSRRDIYARATLNGAIEILRRDYSIGKGLKDTFWELLHSSLLSIYERRIIFSICQVLYKEVDSFWVKVPVPSVPLNELKKKIVIKNLEDGKILLKREGRFKIQLARLLSTSDTNKSKSTNVKSANETTKFKSSTNPKSANDTSDVIKPQQEVYVEPKIKFKLNSLKANSKKDVIASSVPTNSDIVFVDKSDGFKISFKINKRKLSKITQSIFDFPVTKPTKLLFNMVEIDGGNVKFNFGNNEKFKMLSKNSSPFAANKIPLRYVKILTKEKRLFLSSTPFTNKDSRENENSEALETNSTESSKSLLNVEQQPDSSESNKVTTKLKLKISNSGNSTLNKDLKNSASSQSNTEKPKSSFKESLPNPLSKPKSSTSSRSSSQEPESKLIERSASPFSKSGSPFSSSETERKKKKKTKAYIHSSTNSMALSEESNSVAHGSDSQHKVTTEVKDDNESRTKPKPKLGLKLKLKPRK